VRRLAGFGIIAVVTVICFGVGHFAVPFMLSPGHTTASLSWGLQAAVGLLVLLTAAVLGGCLFLMADSLGELVIPRKRELPLPFYTPPPSPYDGPFKSKE
jgi:hypothetical protein